MTAMQLRDYIAIHAPDAVPEGFAPIDLPPGSGGQERIVEETIRRCKWRYFWAESMMLASQMVAIESVGSTKPEEGK